MTRSEILGLSKMSEGEQRKLLASNGILKQTVQEFAGSEPRALVYYESLPDLADRLWREITSKRNLPECINFVVRMVEPECKTMSAQKSWWIYNSLPIHRIQAALLAKEGV